jgi:hypothetical protein
MTESEARKITAYLATVYDVPAWTDERLRAFREAIADLDYAATQAAARRYVCTEARRPQPSDIRTLVVAARLQLPGAQAAWGELAAAIAAHATEPAFTHPALTRALRLTGRTWEHLRYLQFNQYAWLRRDFLAAYAEEAQAALTTAAVPPAALPDRAAARQILEAVQRAGGEGRA